MLERATGDGKLPAVVKSWEFYGDERSWVGRLYERMRRRLNERLVHFLLASLENHGKPVPRDPSSSRRLRVLEAGSGTAFATTCFAHCGKTELALCLDLDREALVEARRRDPGLAAVVGDLRNMPFASGAFDIVFNNSTVEHLERPAEAVAEMRRTCRSDGRVFVGVPYLYGPLCFQPLIGRSAAGVWLGRVFSRSSLERLVRSVELKPLGCIRFFVRVFIGVIAAPEARSTVPRQA